MTDEPEITEAMVEAGAKVWDSHAYYRGYIYIGLTPNGGFARKFQHVHALPLSLIHI